MAEPPTPVRTSSRRKKSTERFDFYSNQGEEKDNKDDEDNFEKEEEKPEKFENPIDKIEWKSVTGEKEKDRSNAPKKSVRIRQNFTIQERRRVFQYILDECRSKVPGREGRIAKRKVQTENGWVWQKFREKYGYERDIAVYRIHFDYYSKKLHTVPGLTLDERVDLYYAMDIPITDPVEKSTIIEKYGVTVDEKNIITGSTVCTHWDLEHAASEEKEQDGLEEPPSIREATRYVEYHDGAMWQYIVDVTNRTPEAVDYGMETWYAFKRQQRSFLCTKKSAMSLTIRFRKVLLPNLHIMPFDIETKAALYESLGYPVPQEFREELISSTGVILSSFGFVEEYPNRPVHLILQSQPFPDSLIGITSTKKFSILKQLDEKLLNLEDRRPWTLDEDLQMWEHIRRMATKQPYGVVRKVSVPRTGQNHFWWKFSEELNFLDRRCIAMAKNFKRLRANILSSDYDLKTKIEMYYIVSQPLEEEAIELFKTIAVLVLNENHTIRFAIGDDWMVGRTTDLGSKPDEFYQYHFEDEQYQRILNLDDEEVSPDPNTPTTSSAPPSPVINSATVTHQIMEHIHRFEMAEKIVFSSMSRSQKFPYFDTRHRNQKFLKRPCQMNREVIREPPIKEPKIEMDWDQEVKMEPIDDYEEEKIQGEEFFEEQMVEEKVERPPILYPQRPRSVAVHRAMEYAFDEFQKICHIFHQKVREGSRFLEEPQREAYRAELERLTRLFRASGKNALTGVEESKKKWW